MYIHICMYVLLHLFFICYSLSEKQYEEVFKNTAHIVFLSNTAHIIALSIDSCIAQVGGLKPLLSLSTKKALKVSQCLFVSYEVQ